MIIQTKGFSLIELIVIVAIMGILAAVAIPSFQTQLRNSDLSEAQATFEQAVGRAKALAIRNANGKYAGKAVTRVCLTGSKVSINRDDTDVANCIDNEIWSSNINSAITVKNNGSAFSCMCFDNKGRITDEGDCAAGLSNCSITNNFEFKMTTGETLTQEVF